MVWVTKRGGSTSYAYDMRPGETMADAIHRIGFSSGPWCALDFKETLCVFLSLDDFDVEPRTENKPQPEETNT